MLKNQIDKGVENMKTIQEVKNELCELQRKLSKLDDLEHNFAFDSEDPEQELLAKKINTCLDTAGDLQRQIRDLSSEVFAEGKLVLNINKRYEVDGFELTSGATLEYWDGEEWRQDRIEHFDGSYGLHYAKRHDLSGIYARVRKVY